MTEDIIKAEASGNDLQALYERAREARSAGKVSDAEELYGQILSLDPESWEAVFFLKGYYHALKAKYEDRTLACKTFSEVVRNSFELLDKHIDDAEKKHEAIFTVTKYAELFSDDMVKSHPNAKDMTSASRVYDAMGDALDALAEHDPVYGQQYRDMAVQSWRTCVQNITLASELYGNRKYRNQMQETVLPILVRKIKRHLPSYVGPVLSRKLF